MRLIDADALEKEGWSLHRTVNVDSHTMEYQRKPIADVPTIKPKSDERTAESIQNVPNDELISKKSAIESFLADGMITAAIYVSRMPSAQPELPEWAQTVERWYNKALCLSYVKKPLAWALYQTWKEYDK